MRSRTTSWEWGRRPGVLSGEDSDTSPEKKEYILKMALN